MEPAGATVVVAAPPTATATATGDREWVGWAVGGVIAAVILAIVVAWVVHERSKHAAAGSLLPVTPRPSDGPSYPVSPVTPPPQGGPFYPVTPPATFTRAANTNTVASALADFGLSQNFADPAVGTFSGTATNTDECQARCQADTRCVQYVYDAGTVPPNPLWNKNGCWLRFVMPGAGETSSVPNFITGTRTVGGGRI